MQIELRTCECKIVPEKVPRGSNTLKPPSKSLWFGVGAAEVAGASAAEVAGAGAAEAAGTVAAEVARAGAVDVLEKVLSRSLALWEGADNLGGTAFEASPFLEPRGH